jgi:hypothetical protein
MSSDHIQWTAAKIELFRQALQTATSQLQTEFSFESHVFTLAFAHQTLTRLYELMPHCRPTNPK